jgi:hypothetical protein
MKRSALLLGCSVAACMLAVMGEREAAACGGCFTPQQAASDITDERMLLSVSTQQTTLYDQIRYSGNPSSFAWVLPIHGTVGVGLSADVLFDSVSALTQTTINPPPQNCPPAPQDCQTAAFGGSAAPSAEDGGAADGVTVTKQENVGPYATVQLHPTSTTDAAALETWLSDNGFYIPAAVQPTINQYVAEGFDFLAMKLLPGQGVAAMRPVRVTFPGASLSLPLRMAAIGTGATVGITIWVVADGRYEPKNFPFFHIEDKDLVWDFKTSASNYTTLRTQNAANFGGRGWEMESSIDLSQATVTGVIMSGGRYYGGGGGGAPPAPAGDDYLPVPASGGTPEQTADQVRDADIAALFAGMNGPYARITRMRSDISHDAMTTDFVLGASGDQSEIPNVRQATQSVNLQCPVYDGCQIVGYAPPDQAAAQSHGSSNGTASCDVASTAPAENALGLAAAGSFAFVGLAIARARRRRTSRG